MKSQKYFLNTLMPNRMPPNRMPPKVPEGNSEIMPDGAKRVDLMPLLSDGQRMLQGGHETMTRLKLERTWPRKPKIKAV